MDTSKFDKNVDSAGKKSTDLKDKLLQFGSKAVLGGIALLTTAVVAVGATLKSAVEDTFNWAKELDSIQDIMGVTNKEAAALNFILKKSGTETTQLTSAFTILEKGLVNANGELDEIGKNLDEFGISVFDANGKVKDQASLMKDISEKYNSFSTQQERVNFLTEIFGRSGASLIDVFDTLAAEGGIDKVSDKVEKLGLVIDPAKYEKFTRNIEEIKLAFLGMSVTVVDELMPAVEGFSEWWATDGINTFTQMVAWLRVSIPEAIKESENGFESMTNTWENHGLPVASQLILLYENINTILERLDPSTASVAGKFTALGVAQRLAVTWATLVNSYLKILETSLDSVNKVLFQAIYLWEKLASVSNIGGASLNITNSGQGASGRASGGNVIAGQAYNVAEFFSPERFVPSVNGRIDKMEERPIIVEIDENKITRGVVQGLQKVLV
jgi:hypothetical protein